MCTVWIGEEEVRIDGLRCGLAHDTHSVHFAFKVIVPGRFEAGTFACGGTKGFECRSGLDNSLS